MNPLKVRLQALLPQYYNARRSYKTHRRVLVRGREDTKQAESALETVRQTSLSLQESTRRSLSNLVSEAALFVLGKRYKFDVEFVERRGRIYAEFALRRGKNYVDLSNGVGGGVLDLLSSVLRVACFALLHEQARPTFYLDEPLKNVSVEYRERCALFLKTVSSEMGVQFVVNTHDKHIVRVADRVIHLTNEDGTTVVLSNEKGGEEDE